MHPTGSACLTYSQVWCRNSHWVVVQISCLFLCIISLQLKCICPFRHGDVFKSNGCVFTSGAQTFIWANHLYGSIHQRYGRHVRVSCWEQHPRSWSAISIQAAALTLLITCQWWFWLRVCFLLTRNKFLISLTPVISVNWIEWAECQIAEDPAKMQINLEWNWFAYLLYVTIFNLCVFIATMP